MMLEPKALTWRNEFVCLAFHSFDSSWAEAQTFLQRNLEFQIPVVVSFAYFWPAYTLDLKLSYEKHQSSGSWLDQADSICSILAALGLAQVIWGRSQHYTDQGFISRCIVHNESAQSGLSTDQCVDSQINCVKNKNLVWGSLWSNSATTSFEQAPFTKKS